MPTYLTTQLIANELQRLLTNNMVMGNLVNRQYDGRFAQNGAKVGEEFSIRKHVKFQVKDGEVLQPQDTVEQSVPIRVDKRKHIGFTYQNIDRTLSIDDFSNRYLRDPVNKLANQIDQDICALARDVSNFVGTPATLATATATYLDAGALMSEEGVPFGAGVRNSVFGPRTQSGFVEAVKGQFNPQSQISGFLQSAMVARNFLGLDHYMDQNVLRHTVGLLGTAGAPTSNPLINMTSVAEGATSLVTDGWNASITGILKYGDKITIGTGATAVNAVNPNSYQSTGQLRKFTVLADVNSDGSGNATILVAPALYSQGPLTNVSQMPPNNAIISVWGKGQAAFGDVDGEVANMGLAFHRDAFTLVMVDLERAGEGHGVTQVQVRDPESGMAFLLTESFDARAFQHICRFDCLYGVKAIYPELACVIAG